MMQGQRCLCFLFKAKMKLKYFDLQVITCTLYRRVVLFLEPEHLDRSCPEPCGDAAFSDVLERHSDELNRMTFNDEKC